MEFNKKHIISLNDLSSEEIETILDTAESMKEVSTRDVKKVPALKGTTVVNLFFETQVVLVLLRKPKQSDYSVGFSVASQSKL